MYYINTLNTIANQYQNSTYTTKARHIGAAWGQTQRITNTTKLDQATAPWTATTSSSTTLADEQQGGGDMGYVADYNLVKSVLGTARANKVGTTTVTKYWLASRNYGYSNFNSPSWNFNLRYVDTYGSATSDTLYSYMYSSVYSYSGYSAIRPIITLKSGLTTSGGDGKSASTAWTFS